MNSTPGRGVTINFTEEEINILIRFLINNCNPNVGVIREKAVAGLEGYNDTTGEDEHVDTGREDKDVDAKGEVATGAILEDMHESIKRLNDSMEDLKKGILFLNEVCKSVRWHADGNFKMIQVKLESNMTDMQNYISSIFNRISEVKNLGKDESNGDTDKSTLNVNVDENKKVDGDGAVNGNEEVGLDVEDVCMVDETVDETVDENANGNTNGANFDVINLHFRPPTTLRKNSHSRRESRTTIINGNFSLVNY